MNDESSWKIIGAIAAVGVLGAGGALLLGVINAGSQLISVPVLITLQIMVAILAIAAGGALAWCLIGLAIAAVSARFAELESRYEEQFRRLRAKRPAWIATLLFLTNAVLVLVDKSFDGKERETLIATFSLLIGFWIANQLMTCEDKWKRVVGAVLWFAVLLYFPVTVATYRQMGSVAFVRYLASFDFSVQAFLGIVTLCLIALPALALRVGADAA